MRCTLLSSVAFRVYIIYPRCLIKDTILGKEIFNKISVLISSTNFGRSISRFMKNSVIYYHKFTYSFMKSTNYSNQILLNLDFSREIFLMKKLLKYKFFENPYSGGNLVQLFLKFETPHPI